MSTKSWSDIQIGDYIIEAPAGYPSLAMVYSRPSPTRVGLIYKASGKNHTTLDLSKEAFEKNKDAFKFYSAKNTPDISAIKDDLMELVSSKKLLPENYRIDEELFNLVKDGKLPSAEEMRIMLLRYHKALVNCEKNLDLYNSLLFNNDEQDSKKDSNENLQDGSIGLSSTGLGWKTLHSMHKEQSDYMEQLLQKEAQNIIYGSEPIQKAKESLDSFKWSHSGQFIVIDEAALNSPEEEE